MFLFDKVKKLLTKSQKSVKSLEVVSDKLIVLNCKINDEIAEDFAIINVLKDEIALLETQRGTNHAIIMKLKNISTGGM